MDRPRKQTAKYTKGIIPPYHDNDGGDIESATAEGEKDEKWEKGTRNERIGDNNFPERNYAESGAFNRR